MKCCDNPQLFWGWSHAPSDVPDGRLFYHDISPLVFQGCETCGDTLQVIPIDQFLAQHNKLRSLGFLGKNTRMLFSTGSDKHPENYVEVFAYESLGRERNATKEFLK